MPPPRSSKEKVLVVRGRRYRAMKLLGKGGSSRVYEALDEEKNIVVAIKRVDLSDVEEAQRAGKIQVKCSDFVDSEFAIFQIFFY